jgi:transcriptional regulator with XRE-family HTH domain
MILLMMLDALKRNIKTIRESKEISRERMAEIMEVDANIVKRLEWGKSNIDFLRLQQVSKVFDMSIIDVITFPDIYRNIKNLPAIFDNDKIEATLQIKLSKSKGEKNLKIESIDIK